MGTRKPERAEWARRDVHAVYSAAASGAFAASTDMAVQETTYESIVTRLFITTPGDNIYQLVEREHTASLPVVIKEYQKKDPNHNAIDIEGTFDNPILAYGSNKEIAVVALNAGNYDVHVSMEVHEHISW